MYEVSLDRNSDTICFRKDRMFEDVSNWILGSLPNQVASSSLDFP